MSDLHKTPGLFGTQMRPRDLSKLLRDAGWTDPYNNVKMAATADAESDRYIAAVGQINPDGSQDWGLFQINNRHYAKFGFADQESFYLACIDPLQAVAFARALYVENLKANGTGFAPWFAFGTQRYQVRLPVAARGLCNRISLDLTGKLAV